MGKGIRGGMIGAKGGGRSSRNRMGSVRGGEGARRGRRSEEGLMDVGSRKDRGGGRGCHSRVLV